MLQPLSKLYNDIYIRPSELSFFRNPDGSFPSVDVLIVNKAHGPLRYKILCTARMNYTLSKCRGLLGPGDFVKILVEFKSSFPEKNRRDYFKFQFFDCVENSVRGERVITSYVWPSPTVPPFQNVDSDSCSSIVGRHAEQPPRSIRSRSDFTVGDDSLDRSPTLRSDQSELKTLKSGPKSRSSLDHTPSFFTCSAAPKKQKFLELPSSKNKPPPTLLVADLLHQLRTLFCLTVFVLCLTGICLPLFFDDWTSLLIWFYPPSQTPGPVSRHVRSVSRQACLPTTYLPLPPPLCETKEGCCSPTEPPGTDSKDDFSRHTRLAFHFLKAAIRNLWGAIYSVNPVGVIANLSWFVLGLLTMYTMMHS